MEELELHWNVMKLNWSTGKKVLFNHFSQQYNHQLGQKKLIICFSGTARVTLNPPHQKFLLHSN